MLDTIKLRVPLTQKQHDRIVTQTLADSDPQWVLWEPQTGEIKFRRVRGLSETDQHSFHRQILWDVPTDWYDAQTFLTLELSLPKLWYGHNIYLLYDYTAAIALLKERLEKGFSLEKRYRLPEVGVWDISRLDLCYAWKFPSQQLVKRYMDSLKRIQYPRKKPAIYENGITFSGTTYSLKGYLKYPEFRAHDMKVLLQNKASLEWVNHLEKLAEGVLRFEATLRRKYLKRQGINTVADLNRTWLNWDDECNVPGFNAHGSLMAVLLHYQQENNVDLRFNNERGISTFLRPGMRFTSPPCTITDGTLGYFHPGGGCTVESIDVTSILQFFLNKFVGGNPGMQRVDEVETLLMAVYSPLKAARLTSMWLYVQKFGTAKAKATFGKNSYYTARADMKKAGVSLVDKPENVTVLDRDFLQAFKLEVPSSYVVNRVDDYRDHGNVLNLPVVRDSAF